jgi:hypothetical protein
VSAQPLLAGAAALIERGWSQGADARDVTGCPTEPWNDDARAWSLLGALVCTLEETAEEEGEDHAIRSLATACLLLANLLDVASLEEWNDDPQRRRDEVSNLLAAAGEADRGGSNARDGAGRQR